MDEFETHDAAIQNLDTVLIKTKKNVHPVLTDCNLANTCPGLDQWFLTFLLSCLP